MYKQSFNITEEEAGPMFINDSDEELTPVKVDQTTPTQDEIDVR